jgi:8-oxo-dGTP diphosphatase
METARLVRTGPYDARVLDESLTVAARSEGIEKHVVGAVVHHAGAVLLLTRSVNDTFLPGIEELPSGGVEDGETLAQALDRELLEEVGFSAGTVETGFLATFDYVSGSGRLTRQFTVSVPLNDRVVVLSDEHSAYRCALRPSAHRHDQRYGQDARCRSRLVRLGPSREPPRLIRPLLPRSGRESKAQGR